MKTKIEILSKLSLVKDTEGYDVFYMGERIGSVIKGWSRNGGAGWVAYLSNLQNIMKSHKSLDSIKDAIAFRIKTSQEKIIQP